MPRPSRASTRGSNLPQALLVALVSLTLSLPLSIAIAAPAAAAGEVTLVAVADTYVDSSKPTRNFGSRNEMRTDGSPVLNAYVRFNVTGVSDFTAARLRLYQRTATAQGLQVHGASDNAWDETSMTWQNAPAFGPVVAASVPMPADSWVEIPVTSLVQANGLVSFAITNPDGTAAAIRSRDSAQAPQLIVGTPPPNQNPTATFAYSCVGLSCSFDGSGSSDPDGTIGNYAWQFGTDGVGSGSTTSHTFSAGGDYAVGLTVTDDRGGTGVQTQTVSVSPPPAGDITYVVSRSGSTYQASSSGGAFTGTLKFVVESAVAQLKMANGGTISFTAGDFDLGSGWFELFDIVNITFAGAGIGQTILRNYTGAATDTEPFDVVGADNVVIRDMTIRAGGPLRSTSDAIDFDRGNNSLIERVEITESRARGIIFDGKGSGWTADGNTIRDCVVTGVPGVGIELLASSNNLVENCTVTDAGSHGIEIDKASSVASQPNKKSNDNIIRNNVITRSGQHGIFINSSDRNQILGNLITNSSLAVTSRDGIRISSHDAITCDDNVVDGNTATDTQAIKTQTWGLNIASSLCSGTAVGAANNFAGNRLGSIKDLGTGTTYPPPVGDTQAPTVPTGVAAIAASGCRVNVTWNASTDNVGVAGYGIYRDGVLIATSGGAALTYSDTGVSPGTGYSYQVDAFDASGNRSTKSSPAGVTTPAAACSIVLVATADSYVDASAPTANNGTKNQLRADGQPTVTSYLKFAAGIGGTVTSATLRIWVNSSHSSGFDVHVAGDSGWSETGITYDNAPTYGGIVASSGGFSGGSWVEIDITSVVDGSDVLTLVLTTSSSTAMSLASRESGATAAQLVIQAQ